MVIPSIGHLTVEEETFEYVLNLEYMHFYIGVEKQSFCFHILNISIAASIVIYALGVYCSFLSQFRAIYKISVKYITNTNV